MQTIYYGEPKSEQSYALFQGETTRMREKKNDQINLRLPSSLKNQLGTTSAASGYSMNEIVVRAVRNELSGKYKDSVSVDAALLQRRLLDFGAVPCGPLSEAEADARPFVMSVDACDYANIQSGDWVMEANGESMEGAGIQNGDKVFFRPLQPNRLPSNNDITAVQVLTPDGIAWATIKYWRNTQPPQLVDGNDNVVELPADTDKLIPLAVARAILRRL